MWQGAPIVTHQLASLGWWKLLREGLLGVLGRWVHTGDNSSLALLFGLAELS